MVLTALARLRWTSRFLMHRPLGEADKKALLAKAGDPAQKENRWVDGAHISHARSAHYTNTKDEMAGGLSGNYNFLEGDIWMEAAVRSLPVVDLLREPIMAHYPDDVKGLTLKEWLQVGKTSGKLKPYGSVSIWNDPKTYLPDDLKEAERYFKAIGVDGTIDLRETDRPERAPRQVHEQPSEKRTVRQLGPDCSG